MNFKTLKTSAILTGAAAMLAAGSANAAPIASFEFSGNLAATGVDPGLTSVSDLAIAFQSEDTNAAAPNPVDNQYYLDSTALLINRSNASGTPWGHAATNPEASFSFTVNAGSENVTIESVTVTASSSTNHSTAVRFGAAEATLSYGSNTFVSGGTATGTATASLPSDFIVLANTSQTFYIDLNSSNVNSTHSFDTIVINGSVAPEPGSLALMGMGGLLMLKRRRRSA